MNAYAAPYCISCGDPPLLTYRGRRAGAGPLCAWCIREQILADGPRQSRFLGRRGELLPGGIPDGDGDGGIVIDLRVVSYLVAALDDDAEQADDGFAIDDRINRVIDLDQLALDSSVPALEESAPSDDRPREASRPRRQRPLRAQG